MAMQVSKPQSPAGMRAFNPDRDMIWAMPRLMRRVFYSMGELTEAKLADMFDERCIDVTTYTCIDPEDVGTVAKAIARMFNLMRDFPTQVEKHAEEYKRLWDEHPRAMALVACMLMDSIFSELPTWFDQVRPTSKLAPVPEVEEIEQAANAFLGHATSGE